MGFEWFDNLVAKLNGGIESSFEKLGRFVARWAWVVLTSVIIIGACFIAGFSDFRQNEDLFDLWLNRDSDVRAQIEFEDRYFAGADTRDSVFFLTASNNDVSAATEERLDQMLNMAHELTEFISADYNGVPKYFQQICDRVSTGTELATLPCTRFTPLDCFFEGQYDFTSGVFTIRYNNPTGQPNRYNTRPTFYNKTTEQLHLVIGAYGNATNSRRLPNYPSACFNWANVPIPEGFWLGGVERNHPSDISIITSIKVLSTLMRVAGPTVIAQRLFGTLFPTDDQIDTATDVARDWEAKYINYIEQNFLSSTANPGTNVAYWAFRTRNDLVEDASGEDAVLIGVGYMLMVVFTAISQFSFDPHRSRILAGVAGVGLVALSVFASLGLAAAFFAFPPVILQVMPFLALGLGVDDMFVLAGNFRFDTKTTPEIMTGKCMLEAGSSITMTSVCNLIAFSIATTIQLKELHLFAVSAVLVVVVNYLVVLFGFTAVLSIDARRAKANRRDVFICLTIDREHESAHREGEEPPPKIITAYANVLTNLPVKLIIIVCFATLFGISIWGAQDVELGLPLGDIVPQDHFASDFLTLREEYFGDYDNNFFIGADPVTGEDIPVEYHNPLLTVEMHTIANQLMTVKNINPSVPPPVLGWIEQFSGPDMASLNGGNLPQTVGFVARNWVLGPLGAINANRSAPSMTYVDWTECLCILCNSSAAARGAMQALYLPGGFDVVTMLNERSTVPCFVPKTEQLFINASLSFLQSTIGVKYSDDIAFRPDFSIGGVRHQFLANNLLNIDGYSAFITDTRDLINKYASPYPVFALGFVYKFYERYLDTLDEFETMLIYTAIGIFFASLLFLFNPFASLIMVFVIGMIITEVYGFLTWIGLKVNSICVMNLIMAIGVSVEFTAHITRAFMTESGTRNERMVKALQIMGLPVVFGAFTTFLGVCAMAFAKFPYYRLYFFNLYLLIILACVLNGFILLPVLLSLVGPPTVKGLSRGKQGGTTSTEMA